MHIDKATYAAMYGPTKGDRIRLADTALLAEIENDFSTYGDEVLLGWGKNIRDGLMKSSRIGSEKAVDLLITNVVIIDPVMGIIKGNIGIKDGRIAAIGKAGNRDIMDNPDILIGTGTALLPGEGLIATPGGVDAHVHFSTPRLIDVALASGISTLIGGGAGGVFGLGTNPAVMVDLMLKATGHYPINVGFLAVGSGSSPQPLRESIEAGACGLKIHEDLGAYPAVIDNCLTVADEMDVAVALHTDSFNESCSISETLQAINGRTVHAYHVEGVGGGHIPDILEIVGKQNVISSSTNPTIPYSINTVSEHQEMIIAIHKLNTAIKSDLEAANQRVRSYTMAAESVLHEMGAISIMASDSQGMGRIGETIRKTWQLADRMKKANNTSDAKGSDNETILKYLAKYTINPAITHGIGDYVGSLEPGKMADIVLWKSAFFGVKPEQIIKKGFVAWGIRGDGNGSTRACQPLLYGPMFGALGDAPKNISCKFVSQAFFEAKQGTTGSKESIDLLAPVKATRNIGPENMIRNCARPEIKVSLPEEAVYINGAKVTLDAARSVAMNSLYFI